jgi:hypothetical protein
VPALGLRGSNPLRPPSSQQTFSHLSSLVGIRRLQLHPRRRYGTDPDYVAVRMSGYLDEGVRDVSARIAKIIGRAETQ